MKVYFISGLAADSRVFTHIKLPEGFETVYIDWIKPVNGESLADYARRLASAINYAEPFVLLGLSMGGMIAIEIAKLHPPVATILLSSVPGYHQFPPHFRIAKALKLYRLIPAGLLKSASILKRFVSADSAPDKLILKQVIRDSDPRFIRWALGAILNWDNDAKPANLLCHIHGSKDEIFPVQYCKPTHIISGGTHLMVMNRATEINAILASKLPGLLVPL